MKLRAIDFAEVTIEPGKTMILSKDCVLEFDPNEFEVIDGYINECRCGNQHICTLRSLDKNFK